MAAFDGSIVEFDLTAQDGSFDVRFDGVFGGDVIGPSIAFIGSTTVTSTATLTVDVTDTSGFVKTATIRALLPNGTRESVYDATVFNSPYSSGTQSLITNGFEYAFTRSPAWPGNTTIEVTAFDFAGNATTSTQLYTVTGADTSGPVIGSFVPAAGSVITTTATLQLDVTDAGTGVSMTEISAAYSDGSSEQVYTAGAFVGRFSTASSQSVITNGFRYVVGLNAGNFWALGVVALAVRAADALGNESLALYETNVTDVTAPTFAGATSANTPTLDSLTVHWSAGSDAVTSTGALVYDVAVATSAPGCTGANFASAKVATSLPGATSIVVSGLSTATTYFFCVRCRDQAGNEDTNNVTVSATTLGPDIVAPTFAGATSVDTPTQDSLKIHWSAGSDAVTSTGALVYDVAVATTAPGCTGANFASAKVASSLPGATSIVVAGLTQGTTYFFCVRCRDQAGNEDTNNVTVSAATASRFFFKMRGQDVDCLPTLTYRVWVVPNAPDYSGTFYVGTRCGATPFTNVVVTDSWEV